MSKTVYLLQNVGAGYVGNAPLFWHQSNSGYTPNIDEAKRMTPEEAAQIIRSSRGTHQWKRWHIRTVLKSSYRVADIQLLRKPPKAAKPSGD